MFHYRLLHHSRSSCWSGGWLDVQAILLQQCIWLRLLKINVISLDRSTVSSFLRAGAIETESVANARVWACRVVISEDNIRMDDVYPNLHDILGQDLEHKHKSFCARETIAKA